MSNVASSYYTQPYGANLPLQPRPVAGNGNGTYNVNFNVNPDTYTSAGVQLATKAAPHVPGAVAGYQAKEGIVDGLRRARTIRNARYRSRAYGGRYGSSSRSYKGKSAVGSGSGTMFSGITKAVKSSVLWGGLISLGLNGYKVFKKEQTVATAGANVTGDLASAAVGGAAGAVASAVATPMLAAAFGPASLLVTLGGIGVGIAGYFVADKFLRNTSFFQNLTTKAHDLVAKVTSR
jgi:hypothetical protein